MTERKKDRGSNLGKRSSNSGVLWSLTMTRWKKELLYKHQHSGILYWESPTTTPLSVSLVSSPRLVPHASLFHAISQQSKPGPVEQRSKKVSTDRSSLLVPSGNYMKVSLRQSHATPFSITVPALLQCYSHPAINTQNWAENPTWSLG